MRKVSSRWFSLMFAATVVFGFAASFAPSAAQAGDSIYIQLGTGAPLKGSATAKGYEGWIEAYSMSFSSQRDISPGSGTGAARPQFSAIELVKAWDLSSTGLFKEATYGMGFTDARIVVVSTVGSAAPQIVTDISLKGVFVSAYNVGVSAGGDDRPTESVSLVFSQISIQGYDNTTKAPKKLPLVCWDLTQGTGC